MATYVIFIRDKMKDAELFKTYSGLAGKARGDHKLEALVAYGAVEALEGPPAEGVVLLKFPDREAALAWYNSPAYQEAKAVREQASDYRVIITEGL